ncbi:MAG: hypothetical protein ACE5DW_06845 [Thermodesulfobacteriota bacterium]
MTYVEVEVCLIENLSSTSIQYMKVTVSFRKASILQGTKYINSANVTTFVKKEGQTLSELETEAKESAVEVLKQMIKGQD